MMARMRWKCSTMGLRILLQQEPQHGMHTKNENKSKKQGISAINIYDEIEIRSGVIRTSFEGNVSNVFQYSI